LKENSYQQINMHSVHPFTVMKNNNVCKYENKPALARYIKQCNISSDDI